MCSKYKVWECKIVVGEDAELPPGFDSPPRLAAIDAIHEKVPVIGCLSGWGSSLNKIETYVIENKNELPDYTPREEGYYWAQYISKYPGKTLLGELEIVRVEKSPKGKLVVFRCRANGVEESLDKFEWHEEIVFRY